VCYNEFITNVSVFRHAQKAEKSEVKRFELNEIYILCSNLKQLVSRICRHSGRSNFPEIMSRFLFYFERLPTFRKSPVPGDPIC
jgi:hypothetical protein